MKSVLLFLCAAGALAGAPATVALHTSRNPSLYGTAVELTAIVNSAGTGYVTFYDGVAILGTAPLVNGEAIFNTSLLASGTHSLSAYYSGNAGDNSSAPLAQIVIAGEGNGFKARGSYSVGFQPSDILIDDFNGDGTLDVAVACIAPNSNSVDVLLGNGDGTFRADISTALDGFNNSPKGLAAGDFNRDGKLDLAVTRINGVVSVLLGNGDGTFRLAVSFSIPYANATAVADFNGDGIADLVVTNQSGGPGLTVFIGNGDGTFLPGVNQNSGGGLSLIVTDFNRDGKADLALDFGTGTLIFLGKGDGTFQLPPRQLGIGKGVVVAYFNGDGNIDIAGLYPFPGVALGNGDGSFMTPVVETSSAYIELLAAGGTAVADFNGDGKPDLAVSFTVNTVGFVAILYGHGDGTFFPPVRYSTGSSPGSVAVGDFAGVGVADLAVSDYYSHSIGILLGYSRAPRRL